MKKKIVIKVQIACDKCRSKAMKLAASVEGVALVAVEGEEMNHLVVIGENVDCTNLVTTLRKKVGHSDIVSVKKIEEEEEEKPTETKEPIVEDVVHWNLGYYPYSQVVVYDGAYGFDHDPCTVM